MSVRLHTLYNSFQHQNTNLPKSTLSTSYLRKEIKFGRFPFWCNCAIVLFKKYIYVHSKVLFSKAAKPHMAHRGAELHTSLSIFFYEVSRCMVTGYRTVWKKGNNG